MTIPYQQLQDWKRPGDLEYASNTCRAVRAALRRHSWPRTMGPPRVSLQGSHLNATSIRSSSDVDVLVEATKVFDDNVPDRHLQAFGLDRHDRWEHTWDEYRREVLRALRGAWGDKVKEASKCIRVAKEEAGLLNADVVPCITYWRHAEIGRRSPNPEAYERGIAFWDGSGKMIVNFPKLHRERGIEKNRECRKRYKRLVRILKNACKHQSMNFPSYFLECLLYRVPCSTFTSGRDYREVCRDVLSYLCKTREEKMRSWKCQNGQEDIFGGGQHQIGLPNATRVVRGLAGLLDA